MLRQCLTALCAFFLVACQMTAPDADSAPSSPITAEAIIVTSLDAPPAEAPDATAGAELLTGDQPAPLEPAPLESVAATETAADVAAAEIVPAEAAIPAVLKSPEQLRCERKDGTWARAGKSEARTCVKQTRDGGKQCSKGTQCEGLCLARSGTCAPFAPLFGCNEIFEDDGRRVTLCID